jgi:hypothetical protein
MIKKKYFQEVFCSFKKPIVKVIWNLISGQSSQSLWFRIRASQGLGIKLLGVSLPSMHKALGSIPSISKTEKKRATVQC